MSAHRRANNFRVPEIDSARKGDCRIDIEGCRRAKNRPDVAGILERIEHQHAHLRGALQGIERSVGHLGNCENALRRFCLGSASELRFLYYRMLYSRRRDRVQQRLSSRSVSELWRRKDALNGQRRLEQLLDGAHAFHHEERLSLPRFSSS